MQVLKEYHGILDRHNLLLQACTSGAVTFREQDDLKQAGLGPSLLDGLPQWVIKYAAGIVWILLLITLFSVAEVFCGWMLFDRILLSLVMAIAFKSLVPIKIGTFELSKHLYSKYCHMLFCVNILSS